MYVISLQPLIPLQSHAQSVKILWTFEDKTWQAIQFQETVYIRKMKGLCNVRSTNIDDFFFFIFTLFVSKAKLVYITDLDLTRLDGETPLSFV